VKRKPLAIDLFCGLFGWSEGLTAEGFEVVGFDLEDMRGQFGFGRLPNSQLVIQNVLTLHGSQFKGASLIVASPPCQFFSYCAMPWSKAKALAKQVKADPARLENELALFNACFRIQREASQAAGHHIPMIVENVRGAQPWVGRARWLFGSFALWGDVPALMPITSHAGGSWFNVAHTTTSGKGRNSDGRMVCEKTSLVDEAVPLSKLSSEDGKPCEPLPETSLDGRKVVSLDGGRRTDVGKGARFTTRDCGLEAGIKQGGDWLNQSQPSISRMTSSKSPARKMASAMIAKIPLTLSRHIARTFHPK
jgi:hypothetical protein